MHEEKVRRPFVLIQVQRPLWQPMQMLSLGEVQFNIKIWVNKQKVTTQFLWTEKVYNEFGTST